MVSYMRISSCNQTKLIFSGLFLVSRNRIRALFTTVDKFLICVLFQPSYTPAQFENSLGKLQCVTVKAPRQIIDVGVVRLADNNPCQVGSSDLSSRYHSPTLSVIIRSQ